MTTKNLLVELFVEELPPKALKKLGDAFATQLADQLRALGLINGDSVTTAFASPRRLAAHISHVWLKAADKAVQQKLMPVSVGLDAAVATPHPPSSRSCKPWVRTCLSRPLRWPRSSAHPMARPRPCFTTAW
jgi:glycyl-tRNA synthetase beta subunit